jgi:hypothetical protein
MAARSVKVSKRQAHTVCVCVGKGAVLHLLLLHVGNVLVYLLWGRLTNMTEWCVQREQETSAGVVYVAGVVFCAGVLLMQGEQAALRHMLQDTRRCRCGLLQGAYPGFGVGVFWKGSWHSPRL